MNLSNRAFFDELNSIEKQAVDPLSLLGLGALSHVGSNAVTKLMHGPLGKVRANRMAQGIRQALAGTPQTPGSKMLSLWAGPEHTVAEHTGRGIGTALRSLDEGSRYRALKKLRKTVAMTPELHHTPLFEDVVQGVNRTLETPLPRRGTIARVSMLNKAIPYAPAPLVAITEPAGLVHAGVNLLREQVGKSAPGKHFLRDKLVRGVAENPSVMSLVDNLKPHIPESMAQHPLVQKALERSPAMGKAKELATDLLVSPAALNTYRIGRDLADLGTKPQGIRRMRKLMGAVQPVIPRKPGK